MRPYGGETTYYYQYTFRVLDPHVDKELTSTNTLSFIIGRNETHTAVSKSVETGEGWSIKVGVTTNNNQIVLNGNDGSFTAKTKHFLIDHPLSPGKKLLVHSSLEGPEVGIYYRGEAKLVSGHVIVTLPDYFEALTIKENRTVLLTPKFEVDEPISMLAASKVKDGQFRVRAIDDKNPSQMFHWEVKAVRADVPPLEVERNKTTE